jgi:hypothetical protein
MKIKSLKSVIHNFADSIQSIDYRICDTLIFDEIIKLYDQYEIDTVSFDFIGCTVQPNEANTKPILKIFHNYKDWLPELCESQNCEIEYLEQLDIEVKIDFNSIIQPPRMSDTIQISSNTKVNYKIFERDVKTINLNLDELVLKRNFPQGLREKFSSLQL